MLSWYIMKRLGLIWIFLLSFVITNAQSSSQNRFLLTKKHIFKKWDDVLLKSDDFFEKNQKSLGLSKHDSFELKKSITTPDGLIRKKYYHYYKGYKIINGVYSLHEKDGRIIKSSGLIHPNVYLKKLTFNPFYEFENSVKSQLTSSLEKEQRKILVQNLIFSKFEKCIIDQNFPEYSGKYQTAYKAIANVENEPHGLNEVIYINAQTGKLIYHFTKTHSHSVEGTANTFYYGTQKIAIDSIQSNEYHLADYTRGDGIITNNEDGDVFVNDSKFWDNREDKYTQIATDAHYASIAYYDMMKDKFSFSGIDGDDGALISNVNIRGKFYVNAFWNGTSANFGNGDCDRYHPLTTLAISGHEYAHGFTEFTSGLIYRNESGALNESISDIFGKALEYYNDPSRFTWELGDIIRQNEDVNFIRSMEDPTKRNDPLFYAGKHWWTSTGDNGGVHTNSGVMNYWFYLLVEGGEGINEDGYNFKVDPMGMDKALSIVFTMNAAYLNSTSNYFHALESSIQACEDLFGTASYESDNVIEAWQAVGLDERIDDRDLKLVIESETITACPTDIKYPSCLIINQGQNTILAGTSLSLVFQQANVAGFFTEEYILSEDMKSQDTFFYNFNMSFVNDPINSGTYFITLEYDQETNNSNNKVNGRFVSSETSGLDLQLELAEFNPSNSCLSTIVDRFRYSIRNLGCETIPEEETIYFDIKTDQGDFTLSRTLFFDNEPGDLQSGTVFINNPDIPTDFKTFKASIRYGEDIDLNNNSFEGEYLKVPVVQPGYIENFDINSQPDYYRISGSTFYNRDTIVGIRNNNMLGFYGLRDHSFFRNCDEAEDFYSQYNFKSRMEYCIDASNLDNPIFEFNSMYYRYNNGVAELNDDDYSAMIRVRYTDGESELFFGQREGSFINRKIELPPNYAGELYIDIISLAQNELENHHDFTEQKDLVLLDDIKLLDGNENFFSRFDQGFLIYPNPSHDLIRIQSFDNNLIYNLEIYSINGQFIFEKKNVLNQDWIDISGIENGVYIIKTTDKEENTSSFKFVKQ